MDNRQKQSAEYQDLVIRLERLEIAVKATNKLLEGNGKDGLIDRVSALEKISIADSVRLHMNEDAEKERRAFWRSVKIAVITLLLSNIGTLLVTLLK